jgi:hypothetical protein
MPWLEAKLPGGQPLLQLGSNCVTHLSEACRNRVYGVTLVVLKLHVQSWGSKPAGAVEIQQEGGKARAPAFAETCGLAGHKV